MKIGIIGGGKWGKTLHHTLKQKNNCLIYARNKESTNGYSHLKDVLACEYIIYALPVQITRNWLKTNFKSKCKGLLVASKGIEAKTGTFVNEIFSNFINKNKLAFISGPSFASEIMKKLPATIVINSENKKLAHKFKSFFPKFIKIYTSKDVIGAEICGAYKNVLAIAGGICDGLKLGNNAKAGLISKGLLEMSKFGKHFGAKQKTFLDLSGAGDLFLTAYSNLSRNYRVGLELTKNKNINEILENIGEVAEGIQATKAIKKLADMHKINTPIAHEVYLILNGKNPTDSLKDLLYKN